MKYHCNLIFITVIDGEAEKEVITVNKKQKQVEVQSKPHVVQVSTELPYTETEIRIARLSIEGLSDAAIAEVLEITIEAVRVLKDIIIAKARAMNRGC